MDEVASIRLRDAIGVERGRVEGQITNLQHSFDGIVGAAELTSTDDEHDLHWMRELIESSMTEGTVAVH